MIGSVISPAVSGGVGSSEFFRLPALNGASGGDDDDDEEEYANARVNCLKRPSR